MCPKDTFLIHAPRTARKHCLYALHPAPCSDHPSYFLFAFDFFPSCPDTDRAKESALVTKEDEISFQDVNTALRAQLLVQLFFLLSPSVPYATSKHPTFFFPFHFARLLKALTFLILLAVFNHKPLCAVPRLS